MTRFLTLANTGFEIAHDHTICVLKYFDYHTCKYHTNGCTMLGWRKSGHNRLISQCEPMRKYEYKESKTSANKYTFKLPFNLLCNMHGGCTNYN